MPVHGEDQPKAFDVGFAPLWRFAVSWSTENPVESPGLEEAWHPRVGRTARLSGYLTWMPLESTQPGVLQPGVYTGCVSERVQLPAATFLLDWRDEFSESSHAQIIEK